MRRIYPQALPYLVFAALLLASWNRWIEPYVDSGRELMIPWRVAHGEVLYRQLHFHHGPLAPYLGAAADRLSGGTLAARIALAALIALLHVEGLRRLASSFLTPWRSGLATALAVAVGGFLRPGGWLFPFSFDTALAAACLLWAVLLCARGDGPRDAAAAVFLLAALLSRVELGLIGIVVVAAMARGQPRRLLRLSIPPVAAAAVVYGLFSIGLSRGKLILDGYLAVLDPPPAFRQVYRAYAGLDRPALRATELALAAILLSLAGSLLALTAKLAESVEKRGPRRARLLEWSGLGLLAAVAVSIWLPLEPLAQAIFLLPPVVRVVPPLLLAATAARIWQRASSKPAAGVFAAIPDGALLLGAFFAARLLLAAGYVGPYNAYFLPLPTLLCAAALWRASESASISLGPALPRLATGALILLLLFRVATLARVYRSSGWSRVATPAGSLDLREPVAWTTRQAVEELARIRPAGATLAGFPEAGFFNYVLKKRNPLPLEQFFPGHLRTVEGDRRMIALMRQSPPDLLLLMNVLAVGEGAPAFGTDYSQLLGQYVNEGFEVAAAVGPGARPGARVGDPDFFVEIRVPRRPAPTGTNP